MSNKEKEPMSYIRPKDPWLSIKPWVYIWIDNQLKKIYK